MSGKADDFRHSCGLCMEPYNKGRIPKLLPCFHSFCVSCLTAVVANVAKPDDSVQEKTKTAGTEPVESSLQGGEANEDNLVPAENEDAANKDVLEKEKEDVEGDRDGKQDVAGDGENGVVGNHGDVFLCPSCRAPVTVPAGGVAALQTNFYLDLDLNLAKDLGSKAVTVWCEMCEEGQQSEATHFCNNCQRRMCRSCRRLHDLVTGTREHRVEPITGGSAAKSVKPTEGKKSCQYHPDQLLCFHCQKCDVSICLHCKLTSHEGHWTEDMATAAIRAKEELTGVLTKANKQLRVVDASLSRLERDTLDLTRQKQEVTRQLNANYDVIIAWVTRASDEARETLEAKEQTALNEIQLEQASAHNIKETLSGVVSRAMASRNASLGPDLVLLKNELQVALLSDDTFHHYEKLGSRKQPRIFFECRADPSALDLDLVQVYLGGLL
ncbi:hypothetical protein V1264_015991 [Littorina saxatilis]|uniref:Uncharacterized protein n=2 Tax=Littorina saxatilis TaxID=31220 RepID=A0AAN9BM92_9CAEN